MIFQQAQLSKPDEESRKGNAHCIRHLSDEQLVLRPQNAVTIEWYAVRSIMDLYSLCAYIGIKQPNAIVKRYAEFFQPKFNCVDILEKFSADYVPPEPESLFKGPKRMDTVGEKHILTVRLAEKAVPNMEGYFFEAGF